MSLVLLGILNSQAAAAGGAPAYEHLATTTLSSNASSITLSGLDSYTDYKHLQLRAVWQSTATGTSEGYGKFRFNSDTGSNYAWHNLQGNQSSFATDGGWNQDGIFNYFSTGQSTTPQDGSFAIFTMDILDFANTNRYKTMKMLTGTTQYFPYAPYIRLYSGYWASNNAITSISFTPLIGQITSKTRWSLYGIRG